MHWATKYSAKKCYTFFSLLLPTFSFDPRSKLEQLSKVVDGGTVVMCNRLFSADTVALFGKGRESCCCCFESVLFKGLIFGN